MNNGYGFGVQRAWPWRSGGSTGGGVPAVCRGNIACDQRSGLAVTDHLNAEVGTITMREDLFLGGRMDLQADRHFRGKLARLRMTYTREFS